MSWSTNRIVTPLSRTPTQPFGQPEALGAVEACHQFVEEEETGLAGQGAGDRDELAPTLGDMETCRSRMSLSPSSPKILVSVWDRVGGARASRPGRSPRR